MTELLTWGNGQALRRRRASRPVAARPSNATVDGSGTTPPTASANVVASVTLSNRYSSPESRRAVRRLKNWTDPTVPAALAAAVLVASAVPGSTSDVGFTYRSTWLNVFDPLTLEAL